MCYIVPGHLEISSQHGDMLGSASVFESTGLLRRYKGERSRKLFAQQASIAQQIKDLFRPARALVFSLCQGRLVCFENMF